MNEAITRNRLDHRVDATTLEGAWSQLLSGMNETMAAFADLHGRRREAELELERVFTMSVDLLCIAGFDGYLKRVNPAWMRTFGYTEQELLSRPFIEFVHPDDRAHTEEAVGVLAGGRDLAGFRESSPLPRRLRSLGAVDIAAGRRGSTASRARPERSQVRTRRWASAPRSAVPLSSAAGRGG